MAWTFHPSLPPPPSLVIPVHSLSLLRTRCVARLVIVACDDGLRASWMWWWWWRVHIGLVVVVVAVVVVRYEVQH